MSARHSNSLLFAWQVADLEAKRLHAAFLEPGHLVLGLCKCVDIDVIASFGSSVPNREALLEELLREFRRLRETFVRAGFDAMRFRRYYRTILPEGSAGSTPPVVRLHRNDAAKDAFAAAERVAGVSDGVVYPIHLLYSLLAESDPQREKAIAAVGSNEARLRQTISEHLFLQNRVIVSNPDLPNPEWN
jgi:hypothetical protein